MKTSDKLIVTFDKADNGDDAALLVGREAFDTTGVIAEFTGNEAIATYNYLIHGSDKVDYTKEINTNRPIERGTELVPIGRLETQDAYLLDILKEQGFYLMYNKKETKFGELEYWQVLYPKED